MAGRDDAAGGGRDGVAFLLTQLGTHAAGRFAERVAKLGLTPPQIGLLRAVAAAPGSSQQQLASRLGLLPSRMVALVDELEERGLLRRTRSSTDRRQYALRLTDEGQATMRQVGRLARDHDEDICRSLSPSERHALRDLLGRLAVAHELTPGVHPGFRNMG